MPQPGFTAPLTTSGFASNYIHGGARYEFGQQNVHPFLGLGVGATIFDPQKDGIGSSTNFSLSAEGGVRMMLGKGAQQRFGVRATFRGWFYVRAERHLPGVVRLLLRLLCHRGNVRRYTG